MWCSAADAHLKTSGPCSMWCAFLNLGSMFDCDIAHRRSVEVLYLLYKNRSKPMNTLYGVLHVPHVPVRVTRVDLVYSDIFTSSML